MYRVINSSLQPIQASHIYVADDSIKKLLKSDLFEFMNAAYKWIGGFKSFTGEDDFADRSYLWYITYERQMPKDPSKIDINKVYTVSVYKQKHGLKLVGIGNNRFSNAPAEERMALKSKAKDALVQHIKYASKHAWAEVSGTAESMFRLVLSPKYIIDPEYLKESFPDFADIEILPDNLHYDRTLSNGDRVTKVAYGVIEQ